MPHEQIALRDEGIPTSPGFYWVQRVGSRFVEHGRVEVVEVRSLDGGELWVDGFAEESFEQIGFAWQRVKPFDLV